MSSKKIATARKMLIDYLAKRIKEQGITQEKLAERTGFTQSNISRMLNAKYPPTLDNLLTLCEAANCFIFVIDKNAEDFDRNVEENAILTNELQKYKTLFYQETTRADLLQEQKESDSVEFAEWMSLNAQPRTTSKSQWRNNKTGVVETTEELYQIFKTTKNG